MQVALTYHFVVAGFRFAVEMPRGWDAAAMLPSFAPFRAEESDGERLFTMHVCDSPLQCDGGELWDESVNDLGFTRLYRTGDSYRVALRYTHDGPEHAMLADSRFTVLRVHLRCDDPYAGHALSSLLRLAYSQAVVWHRAVSIHASAVVLDGKGYLFMGQSGTGKSTHSALWQQCFGGCRLLNDDNPTLRVIDGGLVVSGTPWSGKTHCYLDEQYPVGALVRLVQARENRYRPQSGVGAFVALLPGCSVVRRDAEQYDALCSTLADIVEMANVGIMECLPDAAAAHCCREGIAGGV